MHPLVVSAVREAVNESGSTNPEDFELQFNVDVLSPQLKHADPPEVLRKDYALVREAGTFLKDMAIPRMVYECIQLSCVPCDGDSLREMMHKRCCILV